MAPTGELPPIANLVLDPPRADAGAPSGETRPGLAPGARPAVRSKARPAEPEEDRLAALLTPRALVVTAGVLAVIVAPVLFLALGGGRSERAARPASTQTAPSAASAAGFPQLRSAPTSMPAWATRRTGGLSVTAPSASCSTQ